ncbi:TorF family putative porin [Allohahella marinimesophila]|uniref:TorF family putative porin n=1 Tax=Allohahella marinimesophila TaxID=1054972 RepID=A0ABP7PK46_9GAMM
MKKSRMTSSFGLMVTLQLTSSLVSAEVSTNIAAVSNYLFRGVTQTDGSPAVQGGIDFEHASGFYAGTWASNVDFGDETSYELDLYAGFAGAMNDLGYDVGYIYYAYPDAPDSIDFGEIYGELSYGVAALGFAYTTNSDVSGKGLFVQGDLYYYASVEIPLQDGYSTGVLAGFYDFTDDSAPSVGDASYAHASANITKNAGEFGDFSFNLEYADIDEDTALGSVSSSDPKVWLGWSKTF